MDLDVLDFPGVPDETAELRRGTPGETLSELTVKVQELRNKLLGEVFGQDKAVNTFAQGFFQAELNSLMKVRTPVRAMFLFAGPPGVGKTLLAEKIAKTLKLPFARFDMSEYADKEANIEFCGSDRVYKNGKSGNVTGFVIDHPSSVLLFDEMEKAHPVVVHLFLQMLDRGQLRDNFTDEEVSFADTIIILTTNAGKKLYEESNKIDLSEIPGKVVLNALKTDVDHDGKPLFPAAICSRFAAGNVIMFNHLGSAELMQIAKKEIKEQTGNYQEAFDLNIRIDDAVYAALMFSEGGTADGRSISGKAKRFVNDEVFELFRLALSHRGGAWLHPKELLITAEVNESGRKIARLFSADASFEILLFSSSQRAELYRAQAADLKLCHVKTNAAADKKLKNGNIGFVLIDMEYGFSGEREYLNYEDVNSGARDFLRYIREYYDSLPVYLIEDSSAPFTDEEKYSYLRRGVRGIFANDDAFASRLRSTVAHIHQQNSMDELAKSNRLVEFETAQSISADGRSAEIKLFDFRFGVAVDAEDVQNVLSNVSRPDVTFERIIGAEDAKAELRYFITYLKNPQKYIGTGLHAPKGVLLYGPPGTGKTMLAKAMAKESGATFIATEGNAFLKKYSGEGKDMVHELFRTARKYAPSVLFIDEIDAIAKERTCGSDRNDREATLTALLTEMDGFATDPSKPVFVLAATNFIAAPGSKKSLDAALMRRFDRRVFVDLPNRDERIRYFELRFSENQAFHISEELKNNLAVRSTGMSFADLASVLDFSLRTAVMEDKLTVTDAVLEKAFETCQYGEAGQQTPEQLLRTARHEAGHALLCYLSGETPSYVTVVSRGDHGGYMQRADSENKTYYTAEELLSRIRVSLGGRAAEIVYYGERDGLATTAASDLAAATGIAGRMICDYGMDGDFGISAWGANALDNTEVRKRVNAILGEQLQLAIREVETHKPAIDALAGELIDKTHLIGSEIEAVFKGSLINSCQ